MHLNLRLLLVALPLALAAPVQNEGTAPENSSPQGPALAVSPPPPAASPAAPGGAPAGSLPGGLGELSSLTSLLGPVLGLAGLPTGNIPIVGGGSLPLSGLPLRKLVRNIEKSARDTLLDDIYTHLQSKRQLNPVLSSVGNLAAVSDATHIPTEELSKLSPEELKTLIYTLQALGYFPKGLFGRESYDILERQLPTATLINLLKTAGVPTDLLASLSPAQLTALAGILGVLPGGLRVRDPEYATSDIYSKRQLPTATLLNLLKGAGVPANELAGFSPSQLSILASILGLLPGVLRRDLGGSIYERQLPTNPTALLNLLKGVVPADQLAGLNPEQLLALAQVLQALGAFKGVLPIQMARDLEERQVEFNTATLLTMLTKAGIPKEMLVALTPQQLQDMISLLPGHVLGNLNSN